MNECRLILASGSPRRHEMLMQAGIGFQVVKSGVDESLAVGETAADYVTRLSLEKAQAVAERHPGKVVLAADTTVEIEGTILGKPTSKEEGRKMLESLSATVHRVLTGVTVMDNDHEETFSVTTEVLFRSISPAEMGWYWETGEPADKAGGYGLQGIGAVFVKSINGSYTNVIGLPLAETVETLRRFRIECVGHQSGESVSDEREMLAIRGSNNV